MVSRELFWLADSCEGEKKTYIVAFRTPYLGDRPLLLWMVIITARFKLKWSLLLCMLKFDAWLENTIFIVKTHIVYGHKEPVLLPDTLVIPCNNDNLVLIAETQALTRACLMNSPAITWGNYGRIGDKKDWFYMCRHWSYPSACHQAWPTGWVTYDLNQARVGYYQTHPSDGCLYNPGWNILPSLAYRPFQGQFAFGKRW